MAITYSQISDDSKHAPASKSDLFATIFVPENLPVYERNQSIGNLVAGY